MVSFATRVYIYFYVLRRDSSAQRCQLCVLIDGGGLDWGSGEFFCRRFDAIYFLILVEQVF